MITIFVAGAALVLVALVEIAFAGKDLYHYGWFNVLLAALIVVALVALPRVLKRFSSGRARAAAIAVVVGGAVAGFAALASGLLGPDTQTVVAAPGASVRIDALGGSLVFPLVRTAQAQSNVLLVQGNRSSEIVARRFAGPFLLESFARDVVSVDVADSSGGHLTVTQPTGNTFLSPVLLMQSRQSIAGMNLPYDTFAIPAAHRVVKAVLFGPEETARLPALAGAERAVLFDVENQNEVSLKNGIGVARDGQRITLAGIELAPHIFSYPAIRIVSMPDVWIAIVAALIFLAGMGLTILSRPV